MKLENILLHGLFTACLAACVLIFGAMLITTPSLPRAAAAPDHSGITHAARHDRSLPGHDVLLRG